MATQTKASQIGWMFVPQYYTFVNKDPAKLHCFYTKKSTLIHGEEGEDCTPCYGQQEIHEKIMSLGFEDCKVFVSTVDSQSSAENGIVVQVVGELSNKGGEWRKFAQTFFLAEQPNGYFVLNDIFRYIKEESDEDEDEDANAGGSETAAPLTSTHEQSATAITEAGPSSSHDLDLKDAHGPPDAAAPVTVSLTAEHNNGARASLQELANGTEQHQVVELHDEIGQGSQTSKDFALDTVASQIPHVQANGIHDSAPETSEAAVSEPVEEAQKQPEAQVIPESSKPAESETPAAQEKPAEQAPAVPTQASPPKPAGPPAAKTWATLAASGQNKWNTNVKSVTQSVSSSAPVSSSPSGTATPVNTTQSTSKAERGEGSAASGGRGDATRTPQFMNVETGFSVIVHNVTADISHGQLRNKLSEEFAIKENGQKKYAKLAYLDIDRQKGLAYIDFEKEWAMKKALDKGSYNLDGITITFEAGKGNRRDASGFGTNKGAPPVGGKGRSAGRSGGNAPRGSGQSKENQPPTTKGRGSTQKTGGRQQ